MNKQQLLHKRNLLTCPFLPSSLPPPPRAISLDDLVPENFMPSDVTKKQQLPDCEECTGCTTNLTVLVRQAGHCAEGIQCTGGKGHRKQCEECTGCTTNLTVLVRKPGHCVLRGGGGYSVHKERALSRM